MSEILTKRFTFSELTLLAASKRYSTITKMIHGHEDDFTCRDTIPIFENFSYVLALCKTRQKERIKEAEDLLERLLFLQSAEGNFPLYLHQFPQTFDRYQSLRVLIPLLQIERHCLGFQEKTKEMIQKAADMLLSFAQVHIPQDDQVFVNALRAYRKRESFSLSFSKALSSRKLGEYLLFANLMGDTASMQKIHNLYRRDVGYIGPAHDERQEKSFAEPTLLDVAFQDPKILERQNHPILLQASLFDQPPVTVKETIQTHCDWNIYEEENWVSAYRAESGPKEKKKGDHIFRLLFPDHSLVIQEFFHHTVIQNDKNHFKIDFILGEEDRDICLYITHSENVSFLVEGKRATTFQLEDLLTLQIESQKVLLSFFGEGTYYGHFSRGNRYSQKDKNPFAAYDYVLSLRTIKRAPSSRVSLRISVVS